MSYHGHLATLSCSILHISWYFWIFHASWFIKMILSNWQAFNVKLLLPSNQVGSDNIQLLWSVPANGGSPILGYHVDMEAAPGSWRWKFYEHLRDILVIQSEASKIWRWHQYVFSRWCFYHHDMTSNEFRNMFFVGKHVKRDSTTSDVNEANGDGSWERIYDGLVLSFLQIHQRWQPKVIVLIQTEASPKKHPANWGTNQPSKLTFIATGLHASLTFGPKDLHPGKLNGWNPKLEVWKAIFLSIRWFSLVPAADFPGVYRFWGITTGLQFVRPWLVGLRYSFRVYAENRVGWKLRRSGAMRDPSYGKKRLL